MGPPNRRPALAVLHHTGGHPPLRRADGTDIALMPLAGGAIARLLVPVFVVVHDLGWTAV